MIKTYHQIPCLITGSIDSGMAHYIGRFGLLTTYLEDDDNGGYYPVDYVVISGGVDLLLRAFDDVDIKLLSDMTKEERQTYTMVYPELLDHLAD